VISSATETRENSLLKAPSFTEKRALVVPHPVLSAPLRHHQRAPKRPPKPRSPLASLPFIKHMNQLKTTLPPACSPTTVALSVKQPPFCQTHHCSEARRRAAPLSFSSVWPGCLRLMRQSKKSQCSVPRSLLGMRNRDRHSNWVGLGPTLASQKH
jgi:hypothetical protein